MKKDGKKNYIFCIVVAIMGAVYCAIQIFKYGIMDRENANCFVIIVIVFAILYGYLGLNKSFSSKTRKRLYFAYIIMSTAFYLVMTIRMTMLSGYIYRNDAGFDFLTYIIFIVFAIHQIACERESKT